MRLFPLLVGVAMLGALTACSNPQDRAAKAQQRSYEAQEGIAKKRMEFVEKYQKCVADAGSDKQRVEACDTYLRSAEALK